VGHDLPPSVITVFFFNTDLNTELSHQSESQGSHDRHPSHNDGDVQKVEDHKGVTHLSRMGLIVNHRTPVSFVKINFDSTLMLMW
jgi:hypothetical protein